MRLSTGGLRRWLVAGSVAVAVISQLSTSLYHYPFQHLSGEIIANHTRAVDVGGKHINVDTAIIISSSWIPTHPSTYMVKKVVDSIVMITELHPATPIFITVDQFRLDGNINITQIQERSRSLDQYVLNLYNLYLKDPYVHVLPLMTHSHIAGSVAKALDIIKKQYSLTKYLYYLQHDFSFVKTVDHSMLVRAMETRDEINYILFLKGGLLKRVKSCGKESTIDLDTLDHVPRNDTNINPDSTKRLLLPTATYSDNNHFVRFDWYKETIESLKMLTRPPEFPLQKRAFDGCRSGKSMGLYAYDKDGLIMHLDGRTTQDAEY